MSLCEEFVRLGLLLAPASMSCIVQCEMTLAVSLCNQTHVIFVDSKVQQVMVVLLANG